MYLEIPLLQVSHKIAVTEQLLKNAFEVCFLRVSDCILLVHISSLHSQIFILQSQASIVSSYATEPLMCKEVWQQR